MSQRDPSKTRIHGTQSQSLITISKTLCCSWTHRFGSLSTSLTCQTINWSSSWAFLIYDGIEAEKAIPRFCVKGLPKILDFFFFFVLIWWQTDKKQEILKQSCKDLFIWTELPIVWIIIGSDNIFNIEVNGVLAMHVIVHNSLTENRNKLKF